MSDVYGANFLRRMPAGGTSCMKPDTDLAQHIRQQIEAAVLDSWGEGDVIERAAFIAHRQHCGCDDYQEHADEDTSYVDMMRAVAAEGLLAAVPVSYHNTLETSNWHVGQRVEWAGEDDMLVGTIERVSTLHPEALVRCDDVSDYWRWIDFDDLHLVSGDVEKTETDQ